MLFHITMDLKNQKIYFLGISNERNTQLILKEYSHSHVPMKKEHKIKSTPPILFNEDVEEENFVNFTPSKTKPEKKQVSFLEGRIIILKTKM